jgi:hypothetical protein
MGKRQIEVTDEILEHLSETIGEMTSQIDCQSNDRMVDIEDDTPETIPLTARIEERYTAMHAIYYAETTAD